MIYSETDLVKLLAVVEKQFSSDLVKAEEAFTVFLAKSDDAKPAPEKKDEKAEKKPEEKEAPKADAQEAAPEAKADSKEAPPETEEAPAAQEGADNQQAAPAAEDGCDYDEEDLEHMNKMYASMSRGELKAHHDAVKNALDGQAQAQAPAADAQAAPAAPAAEAPSQPMDKCGEMNMSKAEGKVVAVKTDTITVTQANPEIALLKSEFEAQKAKSEGLQKNLDAVTEFLTKLVKKTAPAGKAITEMNAIQKSEDQGNAQEIMSKGEVTAKLEKKASDPALLKSDRDAINAYYLQGASFNTISHLLK